MNQFKTTLLATGLALAVVFTADAKINHKIINVNVDSGDEVSIRLNQDGEHSVFAFTRDELNDQALVDSKLAGLDDKTRETVLKVLHNLDEDSGRLFTSDQVKVLNGGEGQAVSFYSTSSQGYQQVLIDDEEGDGKAHNRVMIFGNNKTIKGHGNAIIKLIERGEFDSEMLEKIQAALDAKR